MAATTRLRTSRGVSLVEALVALAVMGLGLLGVVGMQATLRANSDVSKQRAEAVRIAQAAVEEWRAFETLAAYAAVEGVTGVAHPGTNASFTRSAEVEPGATLPADAPRLKTLTMSVAWEDRSGQTSTINLVSSIAGIAPGLAGALGLPGDGAATQRPRGRHAAIPPGAVDQGSGTSQFAPPGSPAGLIWVFNNMSGVITQICNPVPSCTDVSLFALSGFVRFATGAAQPTVVDAENPASAALPVGVQVNLTQPSVAPQACFTELFSFHVSYFCAVPTTAVPRLWSGRSIVTGLPISSMSSDVAASNYKVCRYTPVRNHTPPGGNASHPLDYVNVAQPLANQNFLVIKAGDGAIAFICPEDDPATPFINGNTWWHQPTS